MQVVVLAGRRPSLCSYRKPTQKRNSVTRPVIGTSALAVILPGLAFGQVSTVPLPNASSKIEEVTVTASKRPQKLRKIPNSITVFTSAQLTQLGAQSLADYIGRAPGVIFDASIPGVSNIVMRGVGTATVNPDQGQSTTGIYLNDIPLTDPGFAISTPDVDAFDVQRVEVLRGPQGTLFGAATLGGAVNYILTPVSLDSYNARAETSVFGTEGSSDIGYSFKGAVNIPIVKDVLGIRLTAIDRTEPGYLDNIGIDKNNSNSQNITDFRVNALWQINADMSLNLFSIYDRLHNADGFDAFPALGDLKRDTFVPEYSTYDTQVNSLKYVSNFDWAALTVVGAYSKKEQNSDSDLTPYYGSPTSSPSVAATTTTRNVEARLTSAEGTKLDWLFGVYYGNVEENYPTPTIQSDIDTYNFTVHYKSVEASAFGEATYHLTDQWKVSFGGRLYDVGVETNTAQGVPGLAPTITGGRQKQTGFSPKGSITYEPNDNFLVYGQVSTGFRSGGANLVAPLTGFATPLTYGSDSLVNYEIGVRPSWFDHHLTLDSTVFYIDWSNIQLRLNRPDGFAYVANAGVAHNYGFENALNWRPTSNLQLQASATYLDSELAQTLALGNGTTISKGSMLPGASRITTSEFIKYRFDVEYKPFVTISHRYVSGALSSFADTPPSPPIGNYNVFDLQAGMTVAGADVTLFANNITNRRGVTASDYAGSILQYFYTRPLTLGLRVDWSL